MFLLRIGLLTLMIDGLFYGSGKTVALPAKNVEVMHLCTVLSCGLVVIYG